MCPRIRKNCPELIVRQTHPLEIYHPPPWGRAPVGAPLSGAPPQSQIHETKTLTNYLQPQCDARNADELIISGRGKRLCSGVPPRCLISLERLPTLSDLALGGVDGVVVHHGGIHTGGSGTGLSVSVVSVSILDNTVRVELIGESLQLVADREPFAYVGVGVAVVVVVVPAEVYACVMCV